MLLISENYENSGACIEGDFWEFDRIYYAIAKYIGNFGPSRECPFPEHTLTAQSLLGLSYELRKAQRGGHQLVVQYNGYPSRWFEDPVKLRERDIKDAKIDYLDELGLLANYDDEDFDPDEVDDDEIELALMDFDASSVETDPNNGFAIINCPEARNENTHLLINMSYSELIYYGLVLHELLKQKSAFWEQKKRYADLDDPNWGLDVMYYYCDAHVDVDRLRLLRDEIFQRVYHKIKRDAFVTHLLPLLQKETLVNDGNLKQWSEITEHYNQNTGIEDEEQLICKYLDELYRA